MTKIISLTVFLILTALLFACGDDPKAEKPLQNPGDTPTLAYQRLFVAVKSKNTEAIKQEFSRNSQAAAQAQAARMKIPVEDVYKNGFTQTTFADSLPEIRDERVKDKMGAIEVWNANEARWEDLPYIREETGWKLAVGDVFANTWRSPGKGRDAKEKEAANIIAGNQMIKGGPNSNSNSNSSAVNTKSRSNK